MRNPRFTVQFALFATVACSTLGGCGSETGSVTTGSAGTTDVSGGSGGTGGSSGGGSGGATGGVGGSGGGVGGSAAGTSGSAGTGGSAGTTGGAGGATGGSGGTGGGGPGVGKTYDVTTGAITLAPGEERIVCVDKRVPSTAPVDLVKISSDLTQGGHHLVFYKSAATVETPTAVPCESFRDIQTGTVPLYIAQKSHTELNFPPKVAYTLPANQMVRVELHFLNTTSQPLAITGTVHLGEALPGTITEHANLMFYGNLTIAIPPQSTATVGPTFRAFGAASPRIFGLTGHQHQRGTGVTIELATSASAPLMKVYENHDWAEPPLTIFDPPIAATPGQGLRYTCTYNNPTNQTVTFGEGVNEEMCFLWAYYYPDMGFEIGIGR